MYYRINDESKKIINVQGFQFVLRVRKMTQFEVNISIETLDSLSIDEILVADEADRVMSAVMTW